MTEREGAWEVSFEDEVCDHLATHGLLYAASDNARQPERALFISELTAQVEETNPTA